MSVITNNQPRLLLSGHELTAKEAADFDYLFDADGIPEGDFFRYRGRVYSMADFMACPATDATLSGWNGYASDSYFSGVLVRYAADRDSVIVGRYYC